MLKNSGAGMLSGTAQAFGPNSPFTLLGGPVSFWLASGQSQAVTIQFQAATVGTAKANLVIAMAEPVRERIDECLWFVEMTDALAQIATCAGAIAVRGHHRGDADTARAFIV